MEIKKTSIEGLFIINPEVFSDKRGYFYESFNLRKFNHHFPGINFVQDNFSKSTEGVLRGMHYQKRNPQGKLVQVTLGSVFDVVVDLREGSSSFGGWYGVELSDENKKQFWIPPGFAHGFQVLTKEVHFQYKCTEFYYPKDEHSLLWSDTSVGIEWHDMDKIISKKDQRGKALKETEPLKT